MNISINICNAKINAEVVYTPGRKGSFNYPEEPPQIEVSDMKFIADTPEDSKEAYERMLTMGDDRIYELLLKEAEAAYYDNKE